MQELHFILLILQTSECLLQKFYKVKVNKDLKFQNN